MGCLLEYLREHPPKGSVLDYEAIIILFLAWVPIAAGITWFFTSDTSPRRRL